MTSPQHSLPLPASLARHYLSTTSIIMLHHPTAFLVPYISWNHVQELLTSCYSRTLPHSPLRISHYLGNSKSSRADRKGNVATTTHLPSIAPQPIWRIARGPIKRGARDFAWWWGASWSRWLLKRQRRSEADICTRSACWSADLYNDPSVRAHFLVLNMGPFFIWTMPCWLYY